LPGIAVIGFAVLFLATNLTAADKTRSSKTVNATPPNYSKKTYVYKTVGACQIEADVYRLAEERVRPVILWVHGGALIMGNRGGLNTQQLQRYLQGGYTVVSIDYRLAPETKLKSIIEDLQDAYAWIKTKGPELFGIDP